MGEFTETEILLSLEQECHLLEHMGDMHPVTVFFCMVCCDIVVEVSFEHPGGDQVHPPASQELFEIQGKPDVVAVGVAPRFKCNLDIDVAPRVFIATGERAEDTDLLYPVEFLQCGIPCIEGDDDLLA